MVQTRAGRGAPEQNVVDVAPSARLTRRRVGDEEPAVGRASAAAAGAGTTSRLTRGKRKAEVVPSSVTEEEVEEEEGEDDDDEEEEEEEEDGTEDREEDEREADEGIEVRNEPPARFNARHVFKGSMSPPPSESEMGSQSVAGTQIYMTPRFVNTGYTRYSSPFAYPSPYPHNTNAHAVLGVAQPPDPMAQGHDGDLVRLPGIEDDGVDDPSEMGDMTHLSQEEVDESQYREEAELKENALDSLWHNSEGLAKLLRDPKPRKQSWRRLLDVFRRNWFSTRVFFAAENELFIDVLRTVRHISEENQTKARAVIVGANAAALLNALSEAVLDRQEDHFSELLELLDGGFPIPFCPSDDWDQNIAEKDVELALDIRTQRLIIRLKSQQDERQHPADVLADLFCTVQASVDIEEALHSGPYKGIEGRQADRFGERAKTILELVNGKTLTEAIWALEERFPLKSPLDGSHKHPEVADFVTKIFAWCGRIIDDVEQGLRGLPLPSRESSPTDSLASSAAQDIVRKDVHEDILSRSNVHLLATLSRQRQLSQVTRSSPASTKHRRGTTREPTVNGGGDDDDHEDDSRREASLAPTDIEGILADLPSTAISRNGIPPSPAEAAPRSNGDVPAPTPVNAPLVRSSFTPVNGAKRTHSQVDDADDSFEHDDREPDPQRRARLDRDRRDMPPPPSRPQKRIRLPSTAPLSSSPPGHADHALPPNGSAPVLPPASSAASSRNSLPSSTNSSVGSFRELSEMNRRAASRGPQQRVPWSERDTRRLIRLIEYHNCLWARIAKRQLPEHRLGDPGPEVLEDCIFDHPRDQQAIRDKARNLKVDILKADLNLYPGFDGIALGKKERQVLISRGKNPDRTEADVDVNGAPTHTEYVPLGGDYEADEGQGKAFEP
ncbi:hypothetical protein LZ32DRAFT_646741 [Colletotrichum eremochloae]|nr:hypothetical protein LZ32DRAFT_646741 [Colletotrichum eremochloae]